VSFGKKSKIYGAGRGSFLGAANLFAGLKECRAKLGQDKSGDGKSLIPAGLRTEASFF